MFLYGLAGFMAGMIIGAVLNRILLSNVSAQELRTNRKLKLKYGALNWFFALAGMLVALYLGHAV